jgi:hypothetical protein
VIPKANVVKATVRLLAVADEPFKTYGIWVLAFSHRGKVLTVFLTDRPIESEADYEIAKEEAVQKLREVLARPDMV